MTQVELAGRLGIPFQRVNLIVREKRAVIPDTALRLASVYRIGSVTKQFTSSAVMQLVEQGRVKLDDSIDVYLPTLPVARRIEITFQLQRENLNPRMRSMIGDL